MKIIVARPQQWIDRSKARTAKIWFHDVEALYDAIPEICKDLGVECIVKTNITPSHVESKPGTIFLGHHSADYKKELKNVWHIKKGYVPGYMYWDKWGYSGWSEATDRYDPQQYYGNIETTKVLCKKYIDNNESKIKQPDNAKVPDVPYVLVLGQRPHDTVSNLAYIDTINLSKLVNQAYEHSGIAVFTKPHPMSLNTKFYGKTIDGSLHKLIHSARAIYTVNSGSGFESLFHYKQVYTSGKCDYEYATTVVKSLEDIKNTMFKSTGSYRILRYLTYCFNEHFVNCYDNTSIKSKLIRCIEEYEV